MLQNASANLLLLGDICNINTTFYFLVNATIPPYRIHPNIMSVSGKQAKKIFTKHQQQHKQGLNDKDKRPA